MSKGNSQLTKNSLHASNPFCQILILLKSFTFGSKKLLLLKSISFGNKLGVDDNALERAGMCPSFVRFPKNSNLCNALFY